MIELETQSLTVNILMSLKTHSDFLTKFCKISDLIELPTTLVRHKIRIDPQATTLIKLN